MGKIFDKFMNSMRLNGDDYEEYDDEYQEDGTYDDYEESYEEDEFYEEAEQEPAPKKTAPKKAAPKTEYTSEKASTYSAPKDNIKPFKTSGRVSEVNIVKVSKYEDGKKVIDILKQNQACLLNLEKISNDPSMIQRVVQFVFGGAYALLANIESADDSHLIFIITPSELEITGDTEGIRNKMSSVTATAYKSN